MPVNVYRHLNGVMSHLFLDVGQGLALLDEERSEGVAEVMQTDMPKSGFL